MDQKTLNHLQIARRNRDLARALLAQSELEPEPWEWVAVVVFYAAVHYVNAYLWKRYHLAPRNHDERTHGVHHDPAIAHCSGSYDVLRDTGFYARYSDSFVLSEQGARDLLEVEFRAVEARVMQALGQPAPVW
ncbi:MAG: hypothetical protein U0893_09840 [Chloroflexota bacterium]